MEEPPTADNDQVALFNGFDYCREIVPTDGLLSKGIARLGGISTHDNAFGLRQGRFEIFQDPSEYRLVPQVAIPKISGNQDDVFHFVVSMFTLRLALQINASKPPCRDSERGLKIRRLLVALSEKRIHTGGKGNGPERLRSRRRSVYISPIPIERPPNFTATPDPSASPR